MIEAMVAKSNENGEPEVKSHPTASEDDFFGVENRAVIAAHFVDSVARI